MWIGRGIGLSQSTVQLTTKSKSQSNSGLLWIHDDDDDDSQDRWHFRSMELYNTHIWTNEILSEKVIGAHRCALQLLFRIYRFNEIEPRIFCMSVSGYYRRTVAFKLHNISIFIFYYAKLQAKSFLILSHNVADWMKHISVSYNRLMIILNRLRNYP